MTRYLYYLLPYYLLQTPLPAQTLTAEQFFALPYRAATPATGVPAAPAMPWVERYELRTETRDFDAGSQEYTLRVLPSTPGKRRAQTALVATLTGQPDFEADDLRCDAVEQRYTDWLRLYAAARELALLAPLYSIQRDRQRVLERRAASLDVDFAELIDLRIRRTELANRRATLLNRRDGLLRHYGLTADSIDPGGLLPPTDLALSAATPLPPDAERDFDRRLVAGELALERAEQRQYVDFLQLKYQGPHDDPLREKFSVGLGLQLPNDGNRRIKVRELELELRELDREATADRTADGERLRTYDLAYRTARADFLRERELLAEERTELVRIAALLRSREPLDVNQLLRIEERAARNALTLLEREVALYEAYLEVLEDTGRLCGRESGGWLLR